MVVAVDAKEVPVWTVEVKQDTSPIWMFCNQNKYVSSLYQQSPVTNHCLTMIGIATAVWSSPSTHLRRARGPSRPSRKRLRLPDILTRLTAKPPTLLLPPPQVRRLPPEAMLPRLRRATQQPLPSLTLHQSSLSRPLQRPTLPCPLMFLLNSPIAPPLSSLPRTRRISLPLIPRRPLRLLVLSPRFGSQGQVSLLPWLVSSRVCSSKCRPGSWHVSEVQVMVICALQYAQGVEV